MAENKKQVRHSEIKHSLPPRLFQDGASVPRDCLVVIYDFENFTGFLSIPDIHRDVARYLNFVDQQIRFIFTGGNAIWVSEELDPSGLTILHEKYLGDGVMFIAQFDDTDPERRKIVARMLCKR